MGVSPSERTTTCWIAQDNDETRQWPRLITPPLVTLQYVFETGPLRINGSIYLSFFDSWHLSYKIKPMPLKCDAADLLLARLLYCVTLRGCNWKGQIYSF